MSARTVVHVLEAFGIGGLERIALTLARHLDPRGWRPHILCLVAGGALASEAERSGIAVDVLGLRDYYPRSIARLARRLRALRPAVVHTHGHFAGVAGRAAAWWAGVPAIIHHLHTTDTSLRSRHHRLERWIGAITTRTLVCSRTVADHATLTVGLDPAGMTVVANGIDPPPAVTRAEALAAIAGAESPVIGCVGALAPHKGQARLLEAVARLSFRVRRGTVVLVGDGSERGRLESIAASIRGWRAILPGARIDARRILPAFDVAVVPSVEREGFGLAALEAMDTGCPVVASRLGGLAEILEDGRTGILVRPGDAAGLAEAIGGLLAWPERGRRIGIEARRTVETFYRASRMVRRVQTIYEEALDARIAA
jgi:glycosyltransferase involved in cell wall biosynthesis